MGQPEQEKWWAMSAVFNRSLKAKDILDAVRVENFVPMRSVVEVCGRRRVRKSVPAIRNLIFVRTTPSSIRELKSRYLFLQYLTHRVDGHTEPIVVPDEQMRHFITVASSDDEHLIYLQPEEVRFGAGDRVRIRGGVFEGVEGVFVRVKGTRDKRVVVMLEGVAAVALVTLPVQLLEAL